MFTEKYVLVGKYLQISKLFEEIQNIIQYDEHTRISGFSKCAHFNWQ